MFYILAIGGTGNKVLEAIVYGAAADSFYYVNGSDEKIPLEAIHMLSIDVDAGCGNTTRAKLACAEYNKVYECMKPLKEHSGFHTRIELRQWSMSSEAREMSINSQVQNHKADQPLAQALFNKTESELEYNEGFRGHPDLGVLFFSDMLEKICDPNQQNQQDDFLETLQLIQRDLEMGDVVRVVLVGSIFGGTGASGIPILSKFLRERFQKFGDQFRMSATLMLPYYKVPASAANEEIEIVIDSTVFMDKAKTALDYYGAEGMVSSAGNRSVYDSLYLLGLPKDAFVSTRIYATGSNAQENDAHMIEWLAARSIAHFFRDSYQKNPLRGCFSYQMQTPTFNWASFDDEEKRYRCRYGGLLKAATVFIVECYPYIRQCLGSDQMRRSRDVSYYTAFFGGVSRMTFEEREKIVEQLDAARKFLAFYCRWMVQMLRSLPPTMRQSTQNEEDLALAAQHYQELLVSKANLLLLEKRLNEVSLKSGQEQLAEMRATIAAMEEDQAELDRKITRQEHNTMLHYARQNAKNDLQQARMRMEESQRALSQLKEETGDRVTPQQIDRQQQSLSAAEHAVQRKECVSTIVENEWKLTVFDIPVSETEKKADEIPQNDLISAELIGLLEPLLRENAGAETDADRENAVKLLANIENMSIQRLKDNVTIQRIMSRLGSGPALHLGRSAASPCAEFLNALSHSVSDEVEQ